MKRLFTSLVLCVVASAFGALAPSPARDLGMGLSYHRVHELPGDIPSSVSPGARILDLRFVRADSGAAAALSAWMRFNASARSPLFILENADTSAVLRALAHGTHPNVIVVAPEGSGVESDISVVVSEATDRKAYDALEKGAKIESLLADNPNKERVDEAYLEKEHLSDSESPEPGGDKPEPAPPLVDMLLQRAVQLHRGLVALKKL